MTKVERHRFWNPDINSRCIMTVGARDLCDQPYSSAVHWHDDDHPYIENGLEAGRGVCWYGVQNVLDSLSGMRCGGPPEHEVHHRVAASEETAVLALAAEETFAAGVYRSGEDAREVREQLRAVMDAPAEDGVGGEPGETWSYDGPLPPAPAAGEIGIPVGAEGSAARAAWNLENGRIVSSGPWPVRQWLARDSGGMPEDWEEPGELICALNVAGEAFTVEVWWQDVRTRMVRVLWGSFVGLTGSELYAAVASWA